jgi:hypothetical protein
MLPVVNTIIQRAVPLLIALILISPLEAKRARPRNPEPEPSAPAQPSVPFPSGGGTALEFNDDLKGLWGLVSPRAADAEVPRHHAELAAMVRDFRSRWLAPASAFFERAVPKGLPSTVVYPFGGVDLLSALAVFPEATDITTLSLEPAGEAAAMFRGGSSALAYRLELVRTYFAFLNRLNFSRSDNLTTLTDHHVPGPVLFSLLAMAIHGFEPVSLRYFRLDSAGNLRYVTQAEVDQARHVGNDHIFDNAEIAYQRGPSGPARVHRHIFADLSDSRFHTEPAVLRYLEKKGRVSAMTKAASFLLWEQNFSVIRKYLLDNMEWMVSDATGIPPSIASAAGFEQETYGRFTGAIMKVPQHVLKEFRDLWNRQPKRPLSFRFGYPDKGTGQHHLMITYPAKAR